MSKIGRLMFDLNGGKFCIFILLHCNASDSLIREREKKKEYVSVTKEVGECKCGCVCFEVSSFNACEECERE